MATNEIAQTGLSSLPPVIYYSEQLFRSSTDFCKNMVLEVDNNLKKSSIKCSNCGSSIIGAPTTVSSWGYDIENGGSHTETFDYFCSDDCEIGLNALAEQCFFDDERDFGFWSSSFGELITYEGLIEFNQNFGVNGQLVSTSTEAAKKILVISPSS